VLATACVPDISGVLSSETITIDVKANASLEPWLQKAVGRFNQARVRTAAKKIVRVNLSAEESGQAVVSLTSVTPLPAVWIPDSEVWAIVLANRKQPAYQGNCVSVATSPLVIALWRPVAESLGWPSRSLGWLDIGSLGADPTAWAYYSGGRFGPNLRIGHTHPGLSATGASALLAIVQAATSKKEAVTVQEIQQPIVQASLRTFEGSVSSFSTSTDALGQTMSERGVSYLGAAVMYESTVLSYGDKEPGLVPIYPFEGTFVATHPACINGSADEEIKEAATLFRDFLLGKDAQQLAVSSGLRPVNTQVAIGAPLDAAHGVDLTQPKIAFAQPGVDAIYAVQQVWQSARKSVNLVMIIDRSGSMQGDKINNVRQAAMQFVQQMGDDDMITVITFSDRATTVVNKQQVGMTRAKVVEIIGAIQAGGNTALYDAIGNGAEVIAQSGSSQRNNAMVVLTDGLDNSSKLYHLDQDLIKLATAKDTTVFTIAYGSDADRKMLTDLAQKANGNFYLGNEANIASIYQEMSAAFGGTAGIGR
jgi:Ca-activated chloride channel family protein